MQSIKNLIGLKMTVLWVSSPLAWTCGDDDRDGNWVILEHPKPTSK